MFHYPLHVCNTSLSSSWTCSGFVSQHHSIILVMWLVLSMKSCLRPISNMGCILFVLPEGMSSDSSHPLCLRTAAFTNLTVIWDSKGGSTPTTCYQKLHRSYRAMPPAASFRQMCMCGCLRGSKNIFWLPWCCTHSANCFACVTLFNRFLKYNLCIYFVIP